MSACENYQRISQEVAQCAIDCGRDPREVCLIAVSKTVGVPVVGQAIEGGSHHFAENRPELLSEKQAAYPDETWHFIGNIQSRKIPQIVQSASLIHSLYQESHARKIDQAAAQLGKIQDVLIEVNISGEESKSGCVPEQALDLVKACCALPNVRVRGLMTMAPQGDAATAKATFKGLALLREQIASQLPEQNAEQFNELSMGMSEDWREAVACGATMVRIGRAIFSDQFGN